MKKTKSQPEGSQDQIQEALNKKAGRNDKLSALLPYAGVAFLLVFFSIATNGQFVSAENLQLLLNQSFEIVVVTTGMIFVYTIGNIDMAVGSIMAVSAMVLTELFIANVPLFICLLAGIATAIALMLVTAFAFNKLRIPAFVGSLCVMEFASGILSFVIKNSSDRIYFPYSRASWVDTPGLKIITLVVLIVLGIIIFNYTSLGKSLIAIGGNPRVARISGIKNKKVVYLAYVIAGVTIGIAALFAVARGGVADSTVGATMQLNVMIAIVLGGFPIFGGGIHRYHGPLIGAVIVIMLTNGLGLMGQANAVGYLVKGILFIVVVAITYDRSKGKLIN